MHVHDRNLIIIRYVKTELNPPFPTLILSKNGKRPSTYTHAMFAHNSFLWNLFVIIEQVIKTFVTFCASITLLLQSSSSSVIVGPS